MVRPLKCRRICKFPQNLIFGSQNSQTIIEMAIDEYETIRLIDLEQLTQEECAVRMNVARTTVQAIYSNARKKLGSNVPDEFEYVENWSCLCRWIRLFDGVRPHGHVNELRREHARHGVLVERSRQLARRLRRRN